MHAAKAAVAHDKNMITLYSLGDDIRNKPVQVIMAGR